MEMIPDSRPTSHGGLALNYWPHPILTRRVTAGGEPFVLFGQSALPVEPSTFLDHIAADPDAVTAPDEIPEESFPEVDPDGAPYEFEYGYTGSDIELDESLMQPTFAFAVTSTTALFSWVPDEQAVSYVVARDGKKASKVTGSSYSDTSLKDVTIY